MRMLFERFFRPWMVFCFLLSAVGTVQAQDFINLELLIENHKDISDELNSRNNIEGSVTAEAFSVKQRTRQYRNVLDIMAKRVEGTLSNVNFGIDAASLSLKAIRVGEQAVETIDFAVSHLSKHPEIIARAMVVADKIKQDVEDIVKLGAMVVNNGMGVVLATNEQRSKFCFMIREKLTRISGELDVLKRYCILRSWMGVGLDQTVEETVRILKGAKNEKAYEKLKQQAQLLQKGLM